MKWWEEWLRPRVVKGVLILLGFAALLIWPGFLPIIMQRLVIAVTQATLELASLLGPLLGFVISLWIIIHGICGLFKKK